MFLLLYVSYSYLNNADCCCPHFRVSSAVRNYYVSYEISRYIEKKKYYRKKISTTEVKINIFISLIHNI